MSTENLITYLLTPVAQIALIIGVAEIIKRVDIIKKKYIPLVDLALGLAMGFAVYWKYGIINAVLVGIALGLSACGLFSGIKNVTEKEEDLMDYIEEDDYEY